MNPPDDEGSAAAAYGCVPYPTDLYQTFNIYLTGYTSRVKALHGLRQVMGYSLHDAATIVDGPKPYCMWVGIFEDDHETHKQVSDLRSYGWTVELRPNGE